MGAPACNQRVSGRLATFASAALLAAAVPTVVAIACGSSRDETREAWQKVPEVLAALGVRDGSSVADIGAGRGFFTLRLARAVGRTGRVYAVDVSARDLERLRERAADERLEQVEIVESAPDDPRLPPRSIDAALIVNAYHEMREHQAILAGIRQALRPGGRLVVVEPIVASRRGRSREDQERSHEIEPRYVEADLREAGFEIRELRDPFTTRPEGDQEWLIVATPR